MANKKNGKKRSQGLTAGITTSLTLGILLTASVTEAVAQTGPATQNLIIRFSEQNRQLLSKDKTAGTSLLKRISTRSGQPLSLKRAMSGNAHVVSIETADGQNLDDLIERLQADPAIESVEADTRIVPYAIPTDLYFEAQWPLHDQAIVSAGMNLPTAWDLSTGSPDTVVAVIDTGILPDHVDLEGRVLDGYDFIAGFELGNNPLLEQYPSYMTYFRTNDGDGRDNDPTDPGDWVDIDDFYAMLSVGEECSVHESTFHGTGIAGIIAGNAGEHGIVGIDWQAKILPIRVSGKCGGSRSDMIDAIRWAAGVEDPALPPNPNPARVINLSLGSSNSCGFTEQEAINDAWNAGAVLVAAVGNEANNVDISPVAPASCEHVISVTAVREDGARAYYSNYGTSVDLAAPGGEDATSDGTPMIVATNHGVKGAIQGSHFKYVAGTSAAAAHVSGVVSLMVGANPQLTPYQLEQLLMQSAREFPQQGLFDCDQQTCGAGLVDAHAAVQAAINGYVEGYEPPTQAAKESQVNDSELLIETGISGGAGGCSINPDAEPEPTFYLLLAGLLLMRWKRAG
ncbi:MAG: S8 family serine peptidase, partial [Gammaproteobacteria bacterium]|nr:S8 family serine peptidase [Gammaproteobacteria bacterium]